MLATAALDLDMTAASETGGNLAFHLRPQITLMIPGWSAPALDINVPVRISITRPPDTYSLSVEEQRVFRAALWRSVEIISMPGGSARDH